MAIYKEDIVDIELSTGNIHRSFLKHSIGTGDSAANRFGVRVFRDGSAVDLTGASCQGYFHNSQGENIALTSYGTVSGNKAFVTLPQACYNYEGQFTLAIKLVGGGVTGTMRIVDGTVDNAHTGGAVAPTGSVPTYQEILALYEEMQQVTESALKFGSVISEGDLNDYKTVGYYRFPNNASGVTNLPYTGSKRASMIIISSTSGGAPEQIIFNATDGEIYQRMFVDGAWQAWRTTRDALMPDYPALENETDIDTIFAPGLYFMSRTGRYENWPFNNIDDRGYMIVIHPRITQASTIQIALEAINGNIYQRMYFDNAWTPWMPVAQQHIVGTNPEYKAVDHGGFFNRSGDELQYQNSPMAFLRAAHAGIRYHNVDVCFTSDGVPVVHHDNTYTDANGVTTTISSTTLSNLASHPAGDSAYSWQIMTLADFAGWIKEIGGVLDMVDISVTSPTNVATLGDYYATHNIRPTWTTCNVLSDLTIFIQNAPGYGAYIVCESDADIQTALSFIQNYPDTKFMFNLHSSGSAMPNVDSYIKNIAKADVRIYVYLYKTSYADTIGIPKWADAVLSEQDNVPMGLYRRAVNGGVLYV